VVRRSTAEDHQRDDQQPTSTERHATGSHRGAGSASASSLAETVDRLTEAWAGERSRMRDERARALALLGVRGDAASRRRLDVEVSCTIVYEGARDFPRQKAHFPP